MRAPWYRALTGCLQMIVRRRDDIEIEAGYVELGELRPRAFQELVAALTEEQRRSLAALAIADIAVWPQLSPADATSVADALEGRSTERALALASVAGKTMPKVAARAAASILAQARALDGGASPDAVDLDAIRQAVHTLARESPDPALYWEQWLRRVVPQAVARSPEAATALARAALQGALVVPARWRFQVSAYRARSGCLVAVVAVGGAQASGHDIAKLAPYRLENGRFETSLTPLVPIDEYRMGYLFQTLFIDTALDDVEQGAYTTASCRNAETGAEWTSPGL